jgi:predicted porin
VKKTTVIASLAVTAIAGAASQLAYAQSSVTLYGVIDAGVTYVSNQKTSGGSGGKSIGLQSGNVDTDRWGLRGVEDLGGGLSAIFTLENGFNVSNGKFANGSDEFGRTAFVGLNSAQYGQITLGRQQDSVETFVAPLSATSFAGNMASHPYDSDNLTDNVRLNNAVMFRSRDYAGLVFGGGYAFSNSATGFRKNNAFTVGAKYDRNNFSIAGAFLQANDPGGLESGNTTGALSSGDGDAQLLGHRQRIYAGALNYTFPRAVVGATVTRTSLDDPRQIASGGVYMPIVGNYITLWNYEVHARYAVTPAFHIGGAYTYTRGHFQTASSTSPKWHQVVLQGDYALSRRTDVYLEGTYQQVTGGAGSALGQAAIYNFGASSSNRQAIVSIGMRTRF